MMKKIFTLIAFLTVTIGAMAQGQYFYEWKDGKYVQRSLAEVDSITFSLPESAEKAYKYVDLGLPSGTLWADRNVGADSPEACGAYFTWDETDHANIDNGCRMPTKDEINELIDNCTWTWVSQNGVKGQKVTGPNGRSIFLPAAGYYYGTDLIRHGFEGCYWSSSLFENNLSQAWGLIFDSSDFVVYEASRNCGFTMRTVKEENDSQVQGSISGLWEKKSGKAHIKFYGYEVGTGIWYTEEAGEATEFRYTYDINTGIVSVTDGVFFEEKIKLFKVKFIDDSIIQLGWWIDGEWHFEEDEKYYRQDGNEAKVNKVDLGLPSGTLWADRNVGADSPEAYGDYFAWGETTTKSTYNWSTYKWCRGSEDTMTKYCTNSYLGTVDNKTVLDLEDDAAYVNMGTEWRMPTYDELNELDSKCTWTRTTQNGVKGYKVTGPNGKSIFLPAAGYRNDGDLRYAGSSAYYSSASLYESGPCNAWGWGEDLGFGTLMYERSDGRAVRAVAR